MQPPSRKTRRARLPVALFALAACAHPEPPRGAPVDFAPPVIVSISPDSGTIVPGFDDDIEIQFDEIISEMAGGRGGGGTGGLGAFLLLSPVDGDIRVNWRRSRITIKPRRGWKPNTIYRLELLPGFQDLQTNTTDTGRVVVFSTGPEFQNTLVTGVAINWARRAFYRNALISVRPAGDSVGYLVRTDSVGVFSLDLAPPGDYLVYGIDDGNGNRRIDAREASDSAPATLIVDDTASVELWMFPQDTNPPRSIAATATDSVAASVQSTHLLDPYQTIDASQVRVRELPDSTPVTVSGLWWTETYDSIQAARQPAPPDSVAADSVGADSAPPAPQPPPIPADSQVSEEPAIFGTRPPLSDLIVVEVVTPWTPEARYVIDILGLRSAAGFAADTFRVIFTAPAAPPPTDSTAVNDSIAVTDSALVRADTGQ